MDDWGEATTALATSPVMTLPAGSTAPVGAAWLGPAELALALLLLVCGIGLAFSGSAAAHGAGYLCSVTPFVLVALSRRQSFRLRSTRGIASSRWEAQVGIAVIALGLVAAVVNAWLFALLVS